jgi:hypothetical protein
VQSLNNKDTLKINVTGNKRAFIRVAPHFLCGDLFFTLKTEGHDPEKVKMKAGRRLSVSNCEVDIGYTGAWAPCQVSIWIFSTNVCGNRSIHSRGQRKADISIGNMSETLPVCYFFEFSKDPVMKISDIAAGTVVQLLHEQNGQVVTTNYNQSVKKTIDIRRFAIVIPNQTKATLNLNFDTTRQFGDWSDEEGPFEQCNNTLKHCDVPDFNHFGLKTDRRIAWWIFAVSSFVIATVIVIFTYCLFTQPEVELNTTFSTVPLGSVTMSTYSSSRLF